MEYKTIISLTKVMILLWLICQLINLIPVSETSNHSTAEYTMIVLSWIFGYTSNLLSIMIMIGLIDNFKDNIKQYLMVLVINLIPWIHYLYSYIK